MSKLLSAFVSVGITLCLPLIVVSSACSRKSATDLNILPTKTEESAAVPSTSASISSAPPTVDAESTDAELVDAGSSETPLTNVTAISAWHNHTCALRGNGEVWCWGELSNPVSDRGDLETHSLRFSSETPVDGPAKLSLDEPAVAVWAGQVDCVRLASKKLRCGARSIDDGANVKQVAAGWALVGDRVVGLEDLLTGRATGSTSPPVPSASASVAASASASASSVSRPVGDSVRAIPSASAIGSAAPIASLIATPSAAPSTSVIAIAPSASASAAASAPPSTASSAPLGPMLNLTEIRGVEQLSANDGQICVRTTGGLVYCFSDAVHAVEPDLADALDVSVGEGFVCARLKPDARKTGHRLYRVVCWGRDNYGQASAAARCEDRTFAGLDLEVPLPNGCSIDEPRDIGPGRGALGLAAGGTHACARMGGKFWCWGDARFGQLGNEPAKHPTREERVPDVRMLIGTGGAESCELVYDVPLYSGLDVSGGVSTSVDLTSIVAGSTHTCVLTVEHVVKCFGDGMSGQLGRCDRVDGPMRDVLATCPADPPRRVHPVRMENVKTSMP